MLLGLDYMHTECHVVHTDLKADNIMMGLGDAAVLDRFVQQQLEHPSPRKWPDNHGRIIYQSCSDFGEAPTESVIASAKITDLGLACWGDEKNYKPIQSNAFMAPEVILQCGWSYPADIWNLGVMLWDLFESFGLFDGIETRPDHYRPEPHLGMMITLLGPPPKEFLKRGAKSSQYFDADGKFKYPEYVNRDCSLEASISRLRGEDKDLFIDMAKKMLTWVPEERWTARQLLEHPFITKEREPAYLTPSPSLSRASTASFNSIIPSRTGTPGPPAPTSHPAMLAPSAAARMPSDRRSLRPITPSKSEEFGPPARAATSPSSGSPTCTLPSRPVTRDRSATVSPPITPNATVKREPINVSNQSSQDMIDAILKRGRGKKNDEEKKAE
jgi:serine/threonine protein kinase